MVENNENIQTTEVPSAERIKKVRLYTAIITISTIIIGIFGGLLIYKWISNKSFDSALANVETVIRNEYKNNCSITSSGHTVNIQIWNNGITSIAIKASNGSTSASSTWDNILHDLGEFAKNINDCFSSFSDATVYISLMNDENPERKLITYKNKLLIYDVVSGYNKGG